MTRREFIKMMGVMGMGAVLSQCSSPAELVTDNRNKRLVIVHLAGGNDGLNTVIPYRNEIYHEARPTLSIRNPEIKLTDEIGLHPALTSFRSLYDRGALAIINGVGYPHATQSHFSAMDTWGSGSDGRSLKHTGWIGRYLDARSDTHPLTAVEINRQLSLMFQGEDRSGFALSSIKHLLRYQGSAAHNHEHAATNNYNLDFLYGTLLQTQQAVDTINSRYKQYSKESYAYGTTLSHDLKLVTDFIGSGLGTEIFYTRMPGFDTHIKQSERQATLLRKLSDTIDSFVADLERLEQFEQTLILIYSEFGRRVGQNGNGGTDHGTANNLFLINPRLSRAGLYNDMPDLQQLIDGNLAYTVDFRSVYAAVLRDWLGMEPRGILGDDYPAVTVL